MYPQMFANLHFLPAGLRTKIILSHAVFNGCGTWFSNYEKNTVWRWLKLRSEENGSKKHEVTEGWTKLHKDERHNSYTSLTWHGWEG